METASQTAATPASIFAEAASVVDEIPKDLLEEVAKPDMAHVFYKLLESVLCHFQNCTVTSEISGMG